MEVGVGAESYGCVGVRGHGTSRAQGITGILETFQNWVQQGISEVWWMQLGRQGRQVRVETGS